LLDKKEFILILSKKLIMTVLLSSALSFSAISAELPVPTKGGSPSDSNSSISSSNIINLDFQGSNTGTLKNTNPRTIPQSQKQNDGISLELLKNVIGNDKKEGEGIDTNPKKAPVKFTRNQEISLNFQNIEVRSLLQILADMADLSVMISDTVKGQMSIRVNNIPWQEALKIIMTSQSLAVKNIGGVQLIAPKAEIIAKDIADLQLKKKADELRPLSYSLIKLNYASAGTIEKAIKSQSESLLSPRGTTSVDVRTNTIWVKDLPENIDEIREFVKKIDIKVPQVLIEARLVSVDKSYAKNIGVRFGLTGGNHSTGTLTGANTYLSEQVLNGLTPAEARSTVPLLNRLSFDLPASAATGGGPATYGVALYKIAKNIFVDLELSAIEEEGLAKVISKPKLLTSNQQKAKVKQGTEIGYLESASSGATSVSFKEAVLSLEITPQITNENTIVMDINISEDRPTNTFSCRDLSCPPAIATQGLQTNVLVNNGETLVLGGIYKKNSEGGETKVPFLGDIPLLGYLFKNKSKEIIETELIIFITPKIVNMDRNKETFDTRAELDKNLYEVK